MRAISLSQLSTLVVVLCGCPFLNGCGGKLPGAGASSGGPTEGVLNALVSPQGKVFGGQSPISDSKIQLYAVGTTGYASAATPLLTTAVTTDANGAFSISGDYTCPLGSYVYITAAGGSPQLSSNPTAINNNIALGAALGPCSGLTSSTNIIINEETTVALAYALAQFSAGTSFGTTLVSKPGSGSSAPADNFASSSSNANGIANAMAIAQLLVNNSSGTSPGVSAIQSVSGVTAVTIGNQGSGYTSIPTVTFSAPSSGTTATGIVGVKIGSVSITNSGSGYSTCGGVGALFSDANQIGGVQATGSVVCGVGSVVIGNGGSGYGTAAPMVSFSAPTTGTTAVGTAVVNASGAVTGVTFTNRGSGYTSSPTVTFSGGSGTGATASTTLGVASVTVTNAGSNYTTLPTVTFTGTSGTAPAAAVVLGGVTTVNVNAGSGYTTAPSVTFSAPSSGATATGTASLGTVSAASGALPEWWQINLLSNILAACVNSTGGAANDGSACGTLFGKVTNAGTAPADTLQAALDLALYPAVSEANISSLYGIIPSTPPFNPYPTSATAITDFSVGIEYQPTANAAALLKQPSSVTLDSLGNAWVASQPTSAIAQGWLVELTPTGSPIPSAGNTGGAYPSDFVVNSYTLAGAAKSMGGQWVQHNGGPQVNGLFAPAIDTSNNVWINDRQNNVMVKIAGSGSTYSPSLNYHNGGGASATGTALNAFSAPTSVYIDGANDVWFAMEGVTNGKSAGLCDTVLGSYNVGPAAFVGGNPSSVIVGNYANWIVVNSPNPYMVVDPNLTDTTGGRPIAGAPFLWTIGGRNGGSEGLIMNYTQPTAAAGGQPSQGCTTPFATIAPALVATSDGVTTSIGASPSALVPAITSDTAYFMSTPADIVFDKFGNLWVANQGIIDTQTAVPSAEVKSSISKITLSYGTTFTNDVKRSSVSAAAH